MTRYVIFGDESTIPQMLRILDGYVAGAVVASNRPQAQRLLGVPVPGVSLIMQPARKAGEFPAFVQAIRALEPTVVLCFSYSLVLPDEILAIPGDGAINIHGGLLPRYRGANVLNWALIEGATETGVTAHYMTDRIDAGEIVLQEKVAIGEDDTAASLKERLDATGFRLVAELHRRLLDGRALPRIPQADGEARCYRRRTPEDGAIDWNQSDRDIRNLVRALLPPWPGAYFIDRQGRKVVIDRLLTLEDVKALRQAHAR